MANIQPDLSVFGNLKTVNDFQRLNEEFALKKQIAAATMQKQMSGGNLPAAVQIVNEMEKAQANGDVQRYNLLHQVAKSFAIDRGMTPAWDGSAETAPESVPQLPSAMPTQITPQQNNPLPPAQPMESPQANAAVIDLYGEGNNTGVNGTSPPTLQQGLGAPTSGPRVIPGYAGAAASIAGAKAGAQEQAKQDVKLVMEPRVTGAVEREKPSAKALGEADAELNERLARQPQLSSAVTRLSALGKVATYTGAGQISNALLRQAGLDVPDAAIARTEYISRIDNEILPLLRQTFGAQFTEREGNSLKTTLGDPNKPPEEKDAVLRSFIQTKMETANSLARQTGKPEPYQSQAIQQSVESIGAPSPASAPPSKGNALDIEFKLKKAGFDDAQIKEYKNARGLK